MSCSSRFYFHVCFCFLCHFFHFTHCTFWTLGFGTERVQNDAPWDQINSHSFFFCQVDFESFQREHHHISHVMTFWLKIQYQQEFTVLVMLALRKSWKEFGLKTVVELSAFGSINIRDGSPVCYTTVCHIWSYASLRRVSLTLHINRFVLYGCGKRVKDHLPSYINLTQGSSFWAPPFSIISCDLCENLDTIPHSKQLTIYHRPLAVSQTTDEQVATSSHFGNSRNTFTGISVDSFVRLVMFLCVLWLLVRYPGAYSGPEFKDNLSTMEPLKTGKGYQKRSKI